MNSREITAIAIKFLAIWLLINVVLQTPSLLLTFDNIEGYTQHQFPHGLYVSVVGAFLLIGSIASILLYRVANSVLNSIPDTDSTDTENISQKFLIQLGGVYFTVSAILLFMGAFAHLSKQSVIELSDYLYMLGALFELAIGFSMLVKSSVWVYWLLKLRGRA
jgi:hypothetical protein